MTKLSLTYKVGFLRRRRVRRLLREIEREYIQYFQMWEDKGVFSSKFTVEVIKNKKGQEAMQMALNVLLEL